MISITNISKRMTGGLVLLMLFLAQTVTSSAEVKLYLEDFTISSSEYKQVALILDNDKAATALEAHIQLPTGLSYANYSYKTDRVKGRGATLQASTNTGELVVLLTDCTIEPGTGAVAYLEFRNFGLSVGDYTINISDIVVSDANAEQINEVSSTTTAVKVLGLGDCSFSAPETVNLVIGQEYQIDVNLTNAGVNNLTAFQGNLTLPAGLEIIPGEDGKFIYSERTPSPMEFKFQEYEGYTAFVISSSQNTTIRWQNGVIFSFKVKATEALAENTTILLNGLRVAASTGQSADVADVKINVVNTSIADKAAFEAYQTEQIAAVEAMAVEGDSEASQKLIADAKAGIEAKTFDYALSLAANKAPIAAIVGQLTADLSAQREKEAAEAAAQLEADAKAAADAKLAELTEALAALSVSDEAAAYDDEQVKAAVEAAVKAIDNANVTIMAVRLKMVEGKLSTDNKETIATLFASAEQAVADASDAIAAAEQAYTDTKAADEAAAAAQAEETAKAAADEKVVELKAAAAVLAVSDEAKAYESETVKTAVAAAEEAITAANTAIAAVEAKIAEGKLSTDNKDALADAVAAADAALKAASDAIAAAEQSYTDTKAADEAAAAAQAEADAKAAADVKLAELKAAAAVLAVSDEAKASNDAKVAAAVQAAEGAIATANDAVAAVESKIAEGKLATDNKEALETVIASAEQAVADAKTAVEAAETAYTRSTYYQYDGTAYIIDAVSGKFMAAGHNWGTQAIVSETGLDLIIDANEETGMVTIDTRVSNGGDNHFLGSNLFMDSPAAEWALVQHGDNFYITNGSQYINVDENDNLIMSDTPREWIIVATNVYKTQLREGLAEASEENPVDATWMLQNPNFNRNDQRVSAWTVSEDCTNKNLNGGNNVNNCAESWHSTFTISQTVENAPAGIYQLTAQGFYRQDDDVVEDLPVFFGGDQTQEVPAKLGTENSMGEASLSFTDGLYTIEPITFEVGADGVLTVGVKGTALHQWVIFDNFQLTYLGEKKAAPEPVKGNATYAVQVDESRRAGESVDVATEADGVVATLTFGVEGGADFKPGKAAGQVEGYVAVTDGNGENGKSNSGTVYYIVPKYNGVIEVAVVLNAGKAFFIEEDGVAKEAFNGAKATEKYYGTFKFNVTAGKKYSIYCTGSKLGFYGFNYDYGTDVEPVEEEFNVTSTGIATVKVAEGSAILYGLNGQRVLAPAKGQVVIVKEKNGQVRKLLVK